MKYIIILCFIFNTFAFTNFFKSCNKHSFIQNSSNHDNHYSKISNIDFESIINNYDHEFTKQLNYSIELTGKKEEDIKDDSFEGYLRSHFITIKNKNNKVHFNRFYVWRKYVGTLLTKQELLEIFNIIVGKQQECDLMNFILLNKIIDETDGLDII